MTINIYFIFIITSMLILMSVGSFYLARRLMWTIPALKPFKNYVSFTLGLFVFVQLLGPFWYRIMPSSPERPFILQWITYISMGFMGSVFFYFLVSEILVFIIHRLRFFHSSKSQVENLERRLFLGVGVFSLASAAAGTATALDGPMVEKVEIPLKDLPQDFHNFSIVQISDLHVGPTIDREYTQKVVDKILPLNPDLVVLTGDLVDGHPDQLRYHLEPLKQLKPPHGVFFCTGNHEYYWGWEQWCEEFKSMGFNVLLNENRLIQIKESLICIGGVTDWKAERFHSEHKPDALKTFKGIPKETIKVLMAHQPGAYPQSLEAGVHVQLSGHTHGGQFFPWNIFVALTHKFYRGLYFYNNLWVYTNRGTGYWGPPQRFGIPSEITQIFLKRENLNG